VSALRFLHKLDMVAGLQREVSAITRLVGQLYPEPTAVTLQRETTESNRASSQAHFGSGSSYKTDNFTKSRAGMLELELVFSTGGVCL